MQHHRNFPKRLYYEKKVLGRLISPDETKKRRKRQSRSPNDENLKMDKPLWQKYSTDIRLSTSERAVREKGPMIEGERSARNSLVEDSRGLYSPCKATARRVRKRPTKNAGLSREPVISFH